MFNQFNPQSNIERLRKQKDEIDNLINNYQNIPQPVNNIINTQQPMKNNLIEWRILNENEEVDNLYVQNETLFVGDKNMVKKSVDGKLEKWEIKKVYPIDKKDEKINQLEEEIEKLKEIINNEHKERRKSNKSNENEYKSVGNDDGNIES